MQREPEPQWGQSLRRSEQRSTQTRIPDVEVGFEVIFDQTNQPMVVFIRAVCLAHWIFPPGAGGFIDIDEAKAHKTDDVFAQFCANVHSAEWDRLVGQLRSLSHLPRNLPLVFLSYFGILEALLTHKPISTDPYDSITRQVKKKVALLKNAWNDPIDCSPFGAQAKPDTIWAKMYLCRSLLAHGDDARFTGELLRCKITTARWP